MTDVERITWTSHARRRSRERVTRSIEIAFAILIVCAMTAGVYGMVAITTLLLGGMAA